MQDSCEWYGYCFIYNYQKHFTKEKKMTYRELLAMLSDSQLDCEIAVETANGGVTPADVVLTPEGGIVLAID